MNKERAMWLTRRAFFKALGLTLGSLILAGGHELAQAEAVGFQPEAMRKRRLGRTNFIVSVIGYGGGAIWGPRQIPILQEAIAMGVNFIDTAYTYAKGQSELVIGEAIKGLRDKVYIATKTAQRFAEGAAREIEESLKRLQVEKIDLIQMHAVGTFASLKSILDPTRGALLAARELQKQGKIGFIGISGAHEGALREFEVMLEAIKTNQFDAIQISYHIEWHGEPVQKLIQLAKEHDVGVIVKKPLGGGRLIAQYGAKRLLQFVLENPDIHTAIPGMVRIEHVHENVPVGYES